MNHITTDIFNLRLPQPLPESGNLLVAQPHVEDACFKRAVIQLVEHDADKGTMGLIVNKQSGFLLGDVLTGLPERCHDVPLWMGGPVGTNMLFFLHRLGADVIPDSQQVARDLWFGGNYDAMCAYLSSGAPIQGMVKCVVGYSGWDAGQLPAELKRHDWAVLRGTDAPLVMQDSELPLWNEAVGSLGPDYARWLNWPLDVHSN